MSFSRELHAAGAAVAEAAARTLGSAESAVAEFPFLVEFLESAEELPPGSAAAPLDRLCAVAGLDAGTRRLLIVLGLTDEDARFGVLFEALQSTPGQHRPTLGLLARWWPELRGALRRLPGLGLARVLNPEAPRGDAALEVPAPLWDALAGDALDLSWARHRAASTLVPLARLRLPPDLLTKLARLPTGDLTVLLRGPSHNGRGTILGALAGAEGKGVLEIDLPVGDPRLALAGPLATALGAVPLLRLDPGPGRAARLGWPLAYRGRVGVAMSAQGGLDGDVARRTVTLRVPMPDVGLRERHWAAALPDVPAGTRAEVARTFRMTSGNIVRAAEHAAAVATMGEGSGTSGRATRKNVLTIEHVREATRSLHREVLDQLATPLEANGGWEDLAVGGEALDDLRSLERRCRHRERLPQVVGAGLRRLSPGVRALFAGPSGTGKTLAARALAAALRMDLYRLDLGAIVNKYIGETEKSLERVLSRAEELDVVLLLDEGDALMTRRTAVTSANDRYANLETNFLLQRLESFDGILLVTTNALDRIDTAFARRMDVIVDFGLPEATERARIWTHHLPAHTIPADLFADAVERCRLSGAQIRNAAIHAALLSLDTDAGEARLGAREFREAIEREYRKMGVPCPLVGSP